MEPSFNVASKSLDERLGLIAINLSSQALIVPGYLRMAVDIPEVKEDSRIDDIQVYLLQSWRLQSLQEPNRIEDVPSIKILLWSLRDSSHREEEGIASSPAEHGQGTVIKQGCGYLLERRFIFPENDLIRSSTSPKSQTGLKAMHKLSVAISYTSHLPDLLTGNAQKPKLFTMACPATLSMCTCAIEALQLPAYGETAELQSLHQTACDQRAKARESPKLLGQRSGFQLRGFVEQFSHESIRKYYILPRAIGATIKRKAEKSVKPGTLLNLIRGPYSISLC